MATEKTKKLLDKLNDIQGKPKQSERRLYIPETNKVWKSVIEDGIRSLPKSYDNAEWTEETDDEGNVDYWTAFDRVYGGGATQQHMINKDGSEYTGKLHSKRVLLKGVDGKKFYTHYTMTTDGRWFDSCGLPTDPPTEIANEDTEAEEKETESKE